ncbi:hypothetical protein, partial [Gemmiger formicilis]|uniref:hypothetical protein n=1 Tax=Gemmiger formicilis TaxID=745368 RepID=UPI00242E697E
TGTASPKASRKREVFLRPEQGLCAILTSFCEKFSSSRWRSAKPGRGNGRFENARIFYRKYGKNTCKSIAKGV